MFKLFSSEHQNIATLYRSVKIYSWSTQKRLIYFEVWNFSTRVITGTKNFKRVHKNTMETKLDEQKKKINASSGKL